MSSWTTATPSNSFLLTPLREGRLHTPCGCTSLRHISTHAPAGGATDGRHQWHRGRFHFYSRPCGRGDPVRMKKIPRFSISTHAPAGGATMEQAQEYAGAFQFLLTPLREGRLNGNGVFSQKSDFYSRPCGRGDSPRRSPCVRLLHFYSRPCGRGDQGPVQ